MVHIEYGATTRAERTSGEWLQVGSHIAELANDLSGRNDLVAFIGEGATEGHAPALFKPQVAEIEVNVELAFGFGVTPAQIGDFRTRASRYEFPRATGAVMHEAFHAKFSLWEIEKAYKELKEDEYEALMFLEESRIEAQGLELDEKNRVFLRACAFDLVIGDLSNEQSFSDLNVSSASKLMALLVGRIVAGIFEESEVANVIEQIKLVIDDTSYNRMVEILAEYQAYKNHYHIEGAYPLAIEWAEIVRNLKKQNGEEDESDSEGSGSGSGASGVSMKDILDALKELSEDTQIKDSGELFDQERKEAWEEQIEESKKISQEISRNKEVANEVFEENASASTGEGYVGGTYSQLVEQRAPLGTEQAAAITVARMLEKAKYRDRDTTVITSQLPYGKLRSSAVVQNEALKAKGMLPTAEAWKRKVRKQTDEPKLTVGVMVDISGSMSDAMQPMATTAWVMSEAVKRVQGKTAMVYYGQDVFPTLKAGQHLDGVRVYSANDSTEKFDKAFRALDGSLNLLNGNGVRLLVVVSDGVYTHEESRKATAWVQRCQQAGVGVLWLTFNSPRRSQAESICNGTQAVVLSGRLDPADAAVEIGKASARALEITNRV